jgi:hypothetical protein
VPEPQFILHLATEDGRLTTIDITDAVNHAHFITTAPDGTPRVTDVRDALPGVPDAAIVHRIMLVTCTNPDGTDNAPNVTVDPEAARWLSLLTTPSTTGSEARS